MSRSSLRAFGLLLVVVFLCPGCFTALLWDWAGEQVPPGHLVGVLGDIHGDVIVYNVAGGTVGVRIPPGWESLPRCALATTGQGDALALATRLAPTALVSLPPTSARQPLRQIDYRTTIGPRDVALGPVERPYGFVQLMNERQEIVHELYGYDSVRRQWVLLANVNLGKYRANAAKVTTGVLLTPLVLVADLAVVAAVVWAVKEGGGAVSFGGVSADVGCPPVVVRVVERERYWLSLR